jgi:hypothetical protein
MLCGPLVEFLTVALVQPSVTNAFPLTLQLFVGNIGYVPSPTMVSYHRWQLLYRNLPVLMPTSTT